MLSPEAERVLRYLVEVEELAEAVLADKRQVGGASAAQGPGLSGWAWWRAPWGSARGPESGPGCSEVTRTGGHPPRCGDRRGRLG